MARNDHVSLGTRAGVLLDRLEGKEKLTLPKKLAADVDDVVAAITPFVKASEAADKAEALRDAALEAVSDADAVLDTSLGGLASALVGAELTPTTAPFVGFSKHTPSKMKRLAFKSEVDAANDLCAAIAKKSPPAAVKKAAGVVKNNATKVAAKLKALTGPEAKYLKARTARDAKLADAVKAMSRFKTMAKAALMDEPETFVALFAPPSAVQAPVKKRAKKTKAPSIPPPPPSNPSAPASQPPPSQVTADARRVGKK